MVLIIVAQSPRVACLFSPSTVIHVGHWYTFKWKIICHVTATKFNQLPTVDSCIATTYWGLVRP